MNDHYLIHTQILQSVSFEADMLFSIPASKLEFIVMLFKVSSNELFESLLQ